METDKQANQIQLNNTFLLNYLNAITLDAFREFDSIYCSQTVSSFEKKPKFMYSQKKKIIEIKI